MKRAVVLSGGGTKGAFELGVWKALNELSIEYDIVTGTSIGSINGALMCMKDYDRCENMWKSMTMTDLVLKWLLARIYAVGYAISRQIRVVTSAIAKL